MIESYTKIVLSDGRSGIVVDKLGPDYVVDVGDSPEEWDTILVHPDEIKVIKE